MRARDHYGYPTPGAVLPQAAVPAVAVAVAAPANPITKPLRPPKLTFEPHEPDAQLVLEAPCPV